MICIVRCFAQCLVNTNVLSYTYILSCSAIPSYDTAALKAVAVYFPEMSVLVYQTTLSHVPQLRMMNYFIL